MAKPDPDAVAATKAVLLRNKQPLSVFAAAIGRSTRTARRTVERYGLPVMRIGNVDYIDVPGAREAMFGPDPTATETTAA